MDQVEDLIEALSQIAHQYCSRNCGLIALKALERWRRTRAAQVVETNDEAIKVFEQTFGKKA
jgi:hypothetical protein